MPSSGDHVWLIVVAAVLAYIGAVISLRMLAQSQSSDPFIRRANLLLASLVAGTAIWTAHFVCMLAQQSHAALHYDPLLTLFSLVFAVAGTMAAFFLSAGRQDRGRSVASGIVLGFGIAAMHYLGIRAGIMAGQVHWNAALVRLSLVIGPLMGVLTLMTANSQMPRHLSPRLAPALFAGAILGLHFCAMAAMTIDMPLGPHTPMPDRMPMALASLLGAVLIVAGGGVAHLIQDRTRHHAHAQVAAAISTDRLTSLPNRQAFEEEVAKRAHGAQTFGVFALEVANIDAINGQFGPKVGDMVIQSLRDRLLTARKAGAFLARTGGAQFSAVGDVDNREAMYDRAKLLHHALSADMLVDTYTIAIDLRIGASIYPADAQDAEMLVRQAQSALLRAMADPLEVVAMHDEAVSAAVQRRLILAHDLRQAGERGELELYYQPQTWIEDMHVIGYEALLRWRHPQLGMIAPLDFIPVAEKTGAIVGIGLWALRAACQEAARWSQPLTVAVNVSPVQLRQPDLPRHILEALLDSGLAPERLEIEVTESLLIDDMAAGLHVLRQIRALGVRIALDDFGTGYSSMDILRRFEFDKLKLDKGFVADIEHCHQARAILHAMLELGRSLAIPVLVEGVETPRQLEFLRKEGCRKVQGYLTGRPLPMPASGPELIVQLPRQLRMLG